ncbi:unnamed protein product [Adineta ricciae]|uniref:Secreted protein n=1 Tax=Adineta ricciae TaxID=249248 RepID=A0A815I367_ADIRI|nr:unnamed protein product [Adineta ricciae]CAF1383414.1 unnamed protein product [Adineta ricciae]
MVHHNPGAQLGMIWFRLLRLFLTCSTEKAADCQFTCLAIAQYQSVSFRQSTSSCEPFTNMPNPNRNFIAPKYLNFSTPGSLTPGIGSGCYVTSSAGRSVLNSFQFATADDH